MVELIHVVIVLTVLFVSAGAAAVACGIQAWKQGQHGEAIFEAFLSGVFLSVADGLYLGWL